MMSALLATFGPVLEERARGNIDHNKSFFGNYVDLITQIRQYKDTFIGIACVVYTLHEYLAAEQQMHEEIASLVSLNSRRGAQGRIA
jgi:hypothetical protein